MKINRLIIILATITSLVGCHKEVDPINPYIRNYGEESLAVNVDKLEYPGRGGSLSFTVESTYDVELVAPEWITLASSEVPGDGRSYIMTATASMNNAEGGSDREGTILVKTRSLERTVTVTQPFYERPDIPESIASAEDLVYFLEKCASALEEGESLAFSSDIDMEGKTFTPVGEFKGILQGNGFRIKNLHSRSPLILRNRGLISGLRIDSSCSFEIPSEEAEQYFGSFVAQNYGTIDGCENDADFIVSESRATKLYLGGIAGYLYADGTISSCINKGAVLYHPQSASANAYLGGITGYSYGAIKDSENYGPITCTPAANTGAYFIGGISSRQEGAGLTGCINHKEAVISTGTEGAKSYIGGIVGYVEGAPATGNNQSYGDLNILLGKESYIGGLQGWQAKVTSGDANVFEGSIVNCNITAQTKASGQYGNNPCKSAGLVTGRFSGQSGYSTLHYGTADKPIRVSGSITCLATGIKQIATPKDYQALLDGDGSKTSVNSGSIPEADYNNILYEVHGDGQTGDPEDLIVKADKVRLNVPAEGGEAGFTVRGNYTMTISTEAEWLTIEPSTVPGDGAYHDVKLIAQTNTHTYERAAQVLVSMPMGSVETVTVLQAGNLNAPESLEVSAESLTLDPSGMEATSLEVTANYDVTISCDADWITVDPNVVRGTESAQKVLIKAEKNSTGAVRSATLTLSLPKGLTKTVSLSQDKFVFTPVAQIGKVQDFIDFIEFCGDSELYPASFVVSLTADIDLKGVELEPVIKFSGTLDGQGHSLKNWSAKAPLFKENDGVVRNLVIDKTCSIAVSANMSYIAETNTGVIEGCTNNASIVCGSDPGASARLSSIASVNKGRIASCINNGEITFASGTDTRAMYLAGIAGSCSTGAVIEDCVNNGKITYTAPSTASAQYKRLSGITAMADVNDIRIVRCTNTAPIAMTIASGSAIKNVRNGGIVGEIKNSVEIEDCRNFGDISCDLAGSAVYLGGLVGYVNSVKKDFSNFAGCAVNCRITGAYAATSTLSSNPLEGCGLVFGSGLASASYVHTIGTETSPVKVSGSLVCGDNVLTSNADNFQNCLNGNKCGNNLVNGFEYVVYNAKFEVVNNQ